MLKWLVGTLVGVVVGISGYFMWYLGGFKPVTIQEKIVGPLKLLYKEHVGPYHKVAPTIIEMETWAKAHDVDCHKTFGQYLDDPRAIEEGRLRARVGCVVDDLSAKVLADLGTDIHVEDIPEHNYVTALFEGSPGIGPMKVYPKVDEYLEAKKASLSGPVIEVYEIHSEKAMTTTYLFPL
jgi:effector-binding domain-containing protein